MKNTTALVSLVLLFTANVPAADAGIILSSEPSFSGVATGGMGNSANSNLTSQGQTFTVPIGATTLNSFSLWVVHQNLSSVFTEKDLFFRGFVMAWDGPSLRASGPILYQSDIQVLAATNPVSFPALSDFTKLTFNTGGVAVTEGTQYVAFMSIIGAGNVANNRVLAGWTFSDVFPDTSLFSDRTVFSFKTALADLTNANSWANPLGFPGPFDLAFEARFNSIPEPTTLCSLVIFALVLGTSARLRKRIA